MTTPPNRRFRFGLRTLLILMTLACVALGLSLYRAQRHQALKRSTEAMITSLGGTIEQAGWSDSPSPGANWFSMQFGFGEPRETRWIVKLAGKAIAPEQARQLGRCGWIRVLDLSDTPVGDTELNELANISKLRELRLPNTQITDAGVVQLNRLERLYVLDVTGTAVTYDGLAKAEQGKSFSDSNFREQLALARLNKSQGVTIDGKWAGISSDVDVFPSPWVPTADSISLDQGDGRTVSEADIADLRQLSNATRFRVQGRSFPRGGLAFLADFKNLEEVGIFDTKLIAAHDDDLATMANLPKLKELALYGNEFTNGGMRHLSAAHQIQSLRIYGFRLTPQLLVHLRGLQGLRELDLIMWNHRAHNEYIEEPTPEEIADAREGMKNLAAIPNLESLAVMGNFMVDDVVASFGELKKLKSLRLDGRYSSKETAQRIQDKLPDCKIERLPQK